jgi:hypothetical protein
MLLLHKVSGIVLLQNHRLIIHSKACVNIKLKSMKKQHENLLWKQNIGTIRAYIILHIAMQFAVHYLHISRQLKYVSTSETSHTVRAFYETGNAGIQYL